jgi:hypothetical protein
MKKIFTSVFLIALMLISFASSTSFAQADTIIVSALPPGNINNVINSDTTASGMLRPNTVYLLKPEGDVDTVYFMTAPIRAGGHVNIVGYVNPVTGHPPVVAPFILEDNSSIPYFFNPSDNDTVSLTGVYFMGTRTDGISFTGRFIDPLGSNNVYNFSHCVLENITGEGTPNLFDTWESDHQSFYVTNCIFRNSQDDTPQNPGFAWVDPGEFPCDTAIFRNNTFFLGSAYILGSSNYAATYIEFSHNTVFYSANGGMFPIPQLHNAVVKNNIFFSVNSASVPTSWGVNAWGSGILILDSLSSITAEPWNLTEADRNLTITNNAYFWPQVTIDNWENLNTGVTAADPLRPPDWINGTAFYGDSVTGSNIVDDRTVWPNVNIADNDNVDPGFDAALVEEAGSKMAEYVETFWTNQTGAGYRPYVNPLTHPITFANVPANWQEISGYPVPENLKYTADLIGDDGLPLGDLNWFKGTVGVKEISNSVPEKFELSQNFPNPFNPTTNLKYSLPQGGFVTLKVFNLLGQEVATLVNQEQSAGEYVVDFDASKLAGGIYMYSIKVGDFSLTKKMVLLK